MGSIVAPVGAGQAVGHGQCRVGIGCHDGEGVRAPLVDRRIGGEAREYGRIAELEGTDIHGRAEWRGNPVPR